MDKTIRDKTSKIQPRASWVLRRLSGLGAGRLSERRPLLAAACWLVPWVKYSHDDHNTRGADCTRVIHCL